MKVSINLPIVAMTICVFAAGLFAQAVPSQTPVAVRGITTEQAGDEAISVGNYAGAIFYFQIQVVWLEGRRGSNDADTLAARERLAGKMAVALAKMTKPPDISEKAEFHAAKGSEFVKKAKTPADFAKAVHEFQEAVLYAPWVFDYHFNLAVVYKSAGQFKFALNSLTLAKLLSLTDKDRRDVNRLRAEIEAAQEMAASASAEAVKAVQLQAAVQSRAESSIEGTWWMVTEAGEYYLEPLFTVVRKDHGFDLKFDSDRSITDFQATENTLRFVFQRYAERVPVELHRAGKFLVGTVRWASNSGVVSLRMARKP